MPPVENAGHRRLDCGRSAEDEGGDLAELVDAGGVDEQGGDGAFLPGLEPILDPVFCADEGDGADDLLFPYTTLFRSAALEEELLDLARLFLVAEPLHELGVVVLALGAH